MSTLKQEYKEGEMTLEEAKALAIKVLSKTLDLTKLTSEKGKLFNAFFMTCEHLFCKCVIMFNCVFVQLRWLLSLERMIKPSLLSSQRHRLMSLLLLMRNRKQKPRRRSARSRKASLYHPFKCELLESF